MDVVDSWEEIDDKVIAKIMERKSDQKNAADLFGVEVTGEGPVTPETPELPGWTPKTKEETEKYAKKIAENVNEMKNSKYYLVLMKTLLKETVNKAEDAKELLSMMASLQKELETSARIKAKRNFIKKNTIEDFVEDKYSDYQKYEEGF